MTGWFGRAWCEVVAVVCVVAALGIAFSTTNAEAFFGAGGLLLLGGFFLALAWLRRNAPGGGGLDDLAQLGARNAARRRGRSLATIAVLASGVFIVVAVDSFRQRPGAQTGKRDSGTGGFALIGESALPIYDDLNTAKGREQFALDEETMRGVRVVPMRVREGDDASCLNLNRALQPRLLGVKVDEMASRGAFRFSDELREDKAMARGWAALAAGRRKTSNIEHRTSNIEAAESDAGEVPAVIDATTLKYALKMKLGDTIEYRDERGATFRVRLAAAVAGSILQGQVVIDERRFVDKFPSAGGYRFFLIDVAEEAKANIEHRTSNIEHRSAEAAGGGMLNVRRSTSIVHRTETVAEALSRALQDRGFEVTPAGRRLAEFQAVENTYLSIFQVLGGLGLLLASAGLAIVVARNVLERRAEFGLLEAVGFRRGQLRALVFAEHRWLIICGLAIGTASALLAVLPSLRERASGFPFLEMGALLAALTLGCFFWAWIATRVALRGSGVGALRSE